MKTLPQLIELETLAHDTGLRGDELQAAWEKRQNQETKPLYVHSKDKQERFFLKMFALTFEGADNPPDFYVWLGYETRVFIYGTGKIPSMFIEQVEG